MTVNKRMEKYSHDIQKNYSEQFLKSTNTEKNINKSQNHISKKKTQKYILYISIYMKLKII